MRFNQSTLARVKTILSSARQTNSLFLLVLWLLPLGTLWLLLYLFITKKLKVFR